MKVTNMFKLSKFPVSRWLTSLSMMVLIIGVHIPVRSQENFTWGVGTHLIGRTDNATYFKYLTELNVGSFRDDANWRFVEKVRGEYLFPAAWDRFIDSARQEKIEPLLIIDYGNPLYENGAKPVTPTLRAAYVAYAKQLVSHYKGRVRQYEIWNEWGQTKPQSAAAYVDLLREVYPAIKAIDPNSIVMGGGFYVGNVRAGWLDEFIDEGGLKYMDGLSIHGYTKCENKALPDLYLDFLTDTIHKTASRPGLPIYITEMGWPSSIDGGPCGTSVDKNPIYMLETFLIAKCLRPVKGLWWYDLINDGRNPLEREHNFGIYDADLKPKDIHKAAVLIGRMNPDITCELPIDTDKRQAKYRVKGVGIMDYNVLLDYMTTRAIQTGTR
jgi:hypothetical protein